MLDLSVESVSFAWPGGFALTGISTAFRRSSHTAVVGPAGAGKTTLLRLLGGEVRPASGRIRIGARDVTGMAPSRLPLLAFPRDLEFSARWSVRHALVAAVGRRSLDREDRLHEIELAADKWNLGSILDQRLRTLCSTERLRAQLAATELLKPAVFVAERLFESAAPADAPGLADEFYRTLRAIGTTVITEPAYQVELGFSDRLLVIEGGTVVQEGTPKEVYDHPRSVAAAKATGEANLVPVSVGETEIDSPIGAWGSEGTPFRGPGVAVVRPNQLRQVAPGEESDLILGVEEAGFYEGAWHIRGLLSGGAALRVTLAADQPLHKGRLIALAYDPRLFTILPSSAGPAGPVVSGVIPPLRESR